MRLTLLGLRVYQASRSRTMALSRSGMEKPRCTRSHMSLGLLRPKRLELLPLKTLPSTSDMRMPTEPAFWPPPVAQPASTAMAQRLIT